MIQEEANKRWIDQYKRDLGNETPYLWRCLQEKKVATSKQRSRLCGKDATASALFFEVSNFKLAADLLYLLLQRTNQAKKSSFDLMYTIS